LHDLGELPAAWEGPPPWPRPVEPAPEPPRAVYVPPPRTPSPREAAFEAVAAIGGSEDPAAAIEHAAESLAALLDDRASVGFYRQELRKLIVRGVRPKPVLTAAAKALDAPADARRGALFTYWLRKLGWPVGAQGDPAPGFSPKTPGAGCGSRAPRHELNVVG
jgi:hypothetical protein